MSLIPLIETVENDGWWVLIHVPKNILPLGLNRQYWTLSRDLVGDTQATTTTTINKSPTPTHPHTHAYTLPATTKLLSSQHSSCIFYLLFLTIQKIFFISSRTPVYSCTLMWQRIVSYQQPWVYSGLSILLLGTYRRMRERAHTKPYTCVVMLALLTIIMMAYSDCQLEGV